MNLFISSDIEGTCGIAAWSETEPGRPDGDYAYFKQQMSREVAAADRGRAPHLRPGRNGTVPRWF